MVALTTGGRLLTAAGGSGGRLLTACGGCLTPMADGSGGLPPLLSAANGSGGWRLDDGEIGEGGELVLSPMLFLLLIPAWLIDLTGNLKQRMKNNYWIKLRKLGKGSKKIKKTNQKYPRLKSYLIKFSAKLYYSVVPYPPIMCSTD